VTVEEPVDESPFTESPHAEMFALAAEAILAQTGVRRGYCLVLGCETGGLAWELAKRSELNVYAVSPDADRVAAARDALDAAGVYGKRVSVEQWPLDEIPYSDYFANLIVSETAMLTGQWPGNPAKLPRMLKPLGGTVMIGQPAAVAAGATQISTETVRSWLSHPALATGRIVEDQGTWMRLVRGSLDGAGSWTHQYANTGNTACGDDQIVQAALGPLYY